MSLRDMACAVAVTVLLGPWGCASGPEPKGAGQAPGVPQPDEQVVPRGEAWIVVDKAVQEDGYMPGYGDLRAGLAELEKDFTISIEDAGDRWAVSLFPHSGAGHDFTFSVMKDSGAIVDMIIGSIFPPPE